jgi:AcrR family transcriptional regulator
VAGVAVGSLYQYFPNKDALVDQVAARSHDPLARVVGGYLDAHASELRRPDHLLAGRLLIDTAEALVHHTALRDPALLLDERWVEEVCDLLERYLLEDAS